MPKADLPGVWQFPRKMHGPVISIVRNFHSGDVEISELEKALVVSLGV